MSKDLRQPRLLISYQDYLDRPDCSAFSSQVGDCYTAGTLQRLASHSRREIRRAAVLAVIDDELRLRRDLKDAQPAVPGFAAKRCEFNLGID